MIYYIALSDQSTAYERRVATLSTVFSLTGGILGLIQILGKEITGLIQKELFMI